uniref:Neuroligin-4, Y-linked n=1 Tax=Magallana gigas TaxID=29159 RepID=K1PQG4_MAGGI
MDLGKVEAFRGIEYHLTSPGLRFLPPIGSYKIWDGISKAVDYWSPCSQSFSHPLTRRYLPEFLRERLDTVYTRFLKSLREDCLSLNVYVPMRATAAGKVELIGRSKDSVMPRHYQIH